jgi:hypothetical protein
VDGACDDDKAKFCLDVEPGEGRTRKCLENHKANLTQGTVAVVAVAVAVAVACGWWVVCGCRPGVRVRGGCARG